MNIIVSCKIVPDDQDIQVASDRTLDYSKAKGTVSTYDLNAIEAAARLAASVEGSKVTAVTAGPASIDDSKLKKNVLARGVDELVMCADDACEGMDARATAEALAALVGEYDVIVCGDGSADNYAQQVDVQLAARLGVPSVNGVTKITPEGGSLLVERTLESVVETVRVPLPAVVSVTPDVAVPRIPGMKDILAAGKKPMDVGGADCAVESAVEVVSTLAPEQADRKLEILDASADGAIEQFAAAIKAAL
ncbi:electron transfer flavoprotein [Gordonibacter sp. 28C]|uniref:electron transfer flavoprotein n=1 Tax=Gordonibacter sp. 28C TaxID=2078569 RepID=UPI000DF805D5|nr:electron transfer flavoprotein [Gordonibacter sp. 28C]RDB62195.1 electron transfer flavoprotein [Gordonibacter sp. 28C]